MRKAWATRSTHQVVFFCRSSLILSTGAALGKSLKEKVQSTLSIGGASRSLQLEQMIMHFARLSFFLCRLGPHSSLRRLRSAIMATRPGGTLPASYTCTARSGVASAAGVTHVRMQNPLRKKACRFPSNSLMHPEPVQQDKASPEA